MDGWPPNEQTEFIIGEWRDPVDKNRRRRIIKIHTPVKEPPYSYHIAEVIQEEIRPGVWQQSYGKNYDRGVVSWVDESNKRHQIILEVKHPLNGDSGKRLFKSEYVENGSFLSGGNKIIFFLKIKEKDLGRVAEK